MGGVKSSEHFEIIEIFLMLLVEFRKAPPNLCSCMSCEVAIRKSNQPFGDCLKLEVAFMCKGAIKECPLTE